MWAIKWDERPPAGKKLGVRGERGTDKNKTGWRGRNLFDLSHCGKQNSWRSPAVVKLLGFFFIIGMHFAVSPSERNANNFQQAGSFLAFRGEKRKKKKNPWRKVSSYPLFFMKNCSFCVASNPPVLAAARRASTGRYPSPEQLAKLRRAVGLWQNTSDEMIPRVVSLLCSLSLHFVLCLCSLWTPHLNTVLSLFFPSTGGIRAKSFSVSLRICFCYFFPLSNETMSLYLWLQNGLLSVPESR